MINYLKSENYRILRKTGLYITTLICFLIIIATAGVLYYSQQLDPNFPYGTSSFFYSNVIGSGLLIIIVGFIYNVTLTGKDTEVIKQTISFGVSRSTIYWSKLIITLSYFIMICILGTILMLVLGETVFPREEQMVSNYLIACVNMVPLVLSGFILIHTLKMLKISDIYVIVILFLVYVFSGDLLRLLFRSVPGLNELYKFGPDTLLHDNLMNFMYGGAVLSSKYWITGVVISVIALFIGANRFGNKDID